MAPLNENFIACIDLDPYELYDEHANSLLDHVYLLNGADIENISMCEAQLGLSGRPKRVKSYTPVSSTFKQPKRRIKKDGYSLVAYITPPHVQLSKLFKQFGFMHQDTSQSIDTPGTVQQCFSQLFPYLLPLFLFTPLTYDTTLLSFGVFYFGVEEEKEVNVAR